MSKKERRARNLINGPSPHPLHPSLLSSHLSPATVNGRSIFPTTDWVSKLELPHVLEQPIDLVRGRGTGPPRVRRTERRAFPAEQLKLPVLFGLRHGEGGGRHVRLAKSVQRCYAHI